jgi:hypothetical protein
MADSLYPGPGYPIARNVDGDIEPQVIDREAKRRIEIIASRNVTALQKLREWYVRRAEFTPAPLVRRKGGRSTKQTPIAVTSAKQIIVSIDKLLEEWQN